MYVQHSQLQRKCQQKWQQQQATITQSGQLARRDVNINGFTLTSALSHTHKGTKTFDLFRKQTNAYALIPVMLLQMVRVEKCLSTSALLTSSVLCCAASGSFCAHATYDEPSFHMRYLILFSNVAANFPHHCIMAHSTCHYVACHMPHTAYHMPHLYVSVCMRKCHDSASSS